MPKIVVEGAEAVPMQEADEKRRWWRFALPWVLISLATDFFFDIDLLILSAILDKPELAVFGVIARIFALSAFAITAVYAVLLPDMFEAEAKKDREDFMRQLGRANILASISAVGVIVCLAIGAPLVLWLFGEEFGAGYLPLLLLSLILLVRALLGPTSLVLSINDRPWASLPAIGAGLVMLVVLNILLTPAFGLLGAAMAALGAVIVWNIWLWRTTKRLTGLDCSIFPALRLKISRRTAISSAP